MCLLFSAPTWSLDSKARLAGGQGSALGTRVGDIRLAVQPRLAHAYTAGIVGARSLLNQVKPYREETTATKVAARTKEES